MGDQGRSARTLPSCCALSTPAHDHVQSPTTANQAQIRYKHLLKSSSSTARKTIAAKAKADARASVLERQYAFRLHRCYFRHRVERHRRPRRDHTTTKQTRRRRRTNQRPSPPLQTTQRHTSPKRAARGAQAGHEKRSRLSPFPHFPANPARKEDKAKAPPISPIAVDT